MSQFECPHFKIPVPLARFSLAPNFLLINEVLFLLPIGGSLCVWSLLGIA